MTALSVRDEAREIKRWLDNCYKAYGGPEDRVHQPAIAEAMVSLGLIADMAVKWAKVAAILEGQR